MNIKEGDYVICIEECNMIGTNSKTLTINKSYKVKLCRIYNDLCIIDDQNDNHYFPDW